MALHESAQTTRGAAIKRPHFSQLKSLRDPYEGSAPTVWERSGERGRTPPLGLGPPSRDTRTPRGAIRKHYRMDRYFGSTRPSASSVANSSSSISLSSRARILACSADLGIARNWKASATESSGGPPVEDERIRAVPAKFARSRFVVRGLPEPIGGPASTPRSAKSQPVCGRSVPWVDMHRGQPTRALLASIAVPCFEFSRPLGKSLLSQGKVVALRGLREPHQIPAAGVGAPHHNQIHALTWTKAQTLRGPEHTILVLGFNDPHAHDRNMGWHGRSPAQNSATRGARPWRPISCPNAPAKPWSPASTDAADGLNIEDSASFPAEENAETLAADEGLADAEAGWTVPNRKSPQAAAPVDRDLARISHQVRAQDVAQARGLPRRDSSRRLWPVTLSCRKRRNHRLRIPTSRFAPMHCRACEKCRLAFSPALRALRGETLGGEP